MLPCHKPVGRLLCRNVELTGQLFNIRLQNTNNENNINDNNEYFLKIMPTLNRTSKRIKISNSLSQNYDM